jgi:hypothetical protein
VVSFSEIFYFAKEEFNVSWNDANDLFFGNILRYKGYNDIWLEELDEEDLAQKILIAFMKKNKVEEMLVLND